MLQALEILSTRLANLVRSLCVMVYSSRRTLTSHTPRKSLTVDYSSHPSVAQAARRSGRMRKAWKLNANRKGHDKGFDAYFQKVFNNTEYEAKDKDDIKLNQAKIPKIHHKPIAHRRLSRKESKVSLNEIKVQLQQQETRKLRRSTSQILGIGRRERIPKVILSRAKKQRQELNPELMFAENTRPIRRTRSSACLSTQARAAREKENTRSLRSGIGAKIARNEEKRNNGILKEVDYNMQRTKSGRLVKRRYKLSL